ncbi:EF-hand domain-containing protein [Roseobacteraceae bacterium NS-SX3]
MKHTNFIAVIVASASLIGAGAALAQPGFGPHGARMSFEEIDSDGNGEISKAEMEAVKEARFAAADANGDGKLSLEEMQAQGAKRAAERAERMLKRLDSDGDGALSLAELPSPRRHGDMFTRIDADGSGGVSKEEFEAMREHRGGKRHGSKPGAQTEQN